MIWLDPLFVPFALSGCILILLGYAVYLQLKIRRFLKGKDAKSLEDAIVNALEDIKKIHNFQKESVAYFEDVEKRLSRSIQAVETIRFNPFKGTGEGGNQSFSTAFLSEKGDGVVISSLYSRDRISIFSKPLDKFNSEFELTDEERGVVEEAKICVSK
jgi:hypothetical protein